MLVTVLRDKISLEQTKALCVLDKNITGIIRGEKGIEGIKVWYALTNTKILAFSIFLTRK